MSSYDSDPEEFIGTDHSVKADPKGKSKPVARASVTPAPAPVDPVVEVPQIKPGSHPKHAIERPRREWEAAAQEVQDAQEELRLSKLALVDAELVEADALTHWLELQPKIDPDKLLHDYANRGTALRAQNVAQGLPAEATQVPRPTNGSPIDRLAANRSRQAPNMISNPLRSPVQRRSV
jgi:hypothetical protein